MKLLSALYVCTEVKYMKTYKTVISLLDFIAFILGASTVFQIMTRGKVAWITNQLAGRDNGRKNNAALTEKNWHQTIDAFSWALAVHELCSLFGSCHVIQWRESSRHAFA